MSNAQPRGYYRPWYEVPTLHLRIEKLIEKLADAQWDGDEEAVEALTTQLTILISKEKMGDEYDPPF